MQASVSSSSEATTQGIRVHVASSYSPDHSRPQDHHWFFSYTIEITNTGAETVQLLSRHWVITDANGKVDEVRGPGVIGVQPVLPPGESFKYTSFCPLRTPFGTMQGSYQMVTKRGDTIDAAIAPFTLSTPYAIN
ncbi:MAG: Co2+/Mg2+ efflux protein ApaG [Nannocystis sp.]|jgi:ApaG protein|nr:Co2+/Mg2+ efflux protein ApaG [Nannocystis sp.]